MTTAIKDKKSLEGRKFRFVVSSAEDAARIIRERLGETAKVLSVKQVNGKGLARFISSPQLEIIVTVPKEEDVVPEESVEAVGEEVAPEEAVASVEAEVPAPDSVVQAESTGVQKNLTQILNRAGFDDMMLHGMQTKLDWASLQTLPVSRSLVEVTQWFKDEYRHVPETPATQRIAFFGPPGVGTTSALCKRLSSDVFISKKMPQVLKLESDTPNADDALRVFCDVIGASLHRENEKDLKLSETEPIYIDIPGANLSDKGQWVSVKSKLDSLNVETRVLVINAAYDISMIKESYRLGDQMGATHVVFTHMDEVMSYSKLWQFVLFGGLPTLFLSCGQDVTGDLESNIMDYMMHKTFPPIIIN